MGQFRYSFGLFTSFLFLFLFLITPETNAQFEWELRWQPYQSQTISHMITGDFNGDRLTDIAFQKPDTTWWFQFSTGSRFSDPVSAGGVQGYNDGCYSGDFNGDGLSDKVTWVNSTDPTWGGWWMHITVRDSQGNYYFNGEGSAPWMRQTETQLDSMFVSDINGDGMSDIIYHTDSSNSWKAMISTGSGFQTSYFVQLTGAASDGVWSGDFTGDGYPDKLRWKNSLDSTGGWWVSRRTTSGGNSIYAADSLWASQTESIDHCIVGDFNGDGVSDVVYHTTSGNYWKGLVSTKSSFLSPASWQSGSGLYSGGAFAGDFNGDGIADKMNWWNSAGGWGGWWISLINTYEPIKVGIFFQPFYWKAAGSSEDPSGFDAKWNNENRDPYKTPVVGWGNSSSDTTIGTYSSQNHDIMDKQIQAIIECGFDFIIADNSNGYVTISPPLSGVSGDGFAKNGTDTLIYMMKSRKSSNQPWIPISLMLGMEFQGPITMCSYYSTWDSWSNQYARQQNAISNLSAYFNDSVYFKYLGKPLLLTYLESGLDYPTIDSPNRPLWNFPNLTIRNTVTWAMTFSRYREVPISPGTSCPGNGIWRYFDGKDRKRFFGWGGGAHDNQTTHEWDPRPLPEDSESMSIMAGSTCWMHSAADSEWGIDDPVYKKRRNDKGEDFYTKSWVQILKKRPKMVLVGDWNNWNEETAIEGCVGSNGWKDLNGNPTYDWYMQITKAYTYILKNNELPAEIYFKAENDSTVYYFDGSCLNDSGYNFKPNYKPVIELDNSTFSSLVSELPLCKNNSNTDGVNTNPNIPKEYFLETNYPNPFNPQTTIKYGLPKDSEVKLVVFNSIGEEVATLVNQTQRAGYYQTVFNAKSLASGIYFYKITAGDFVKTNKMNLVK